MKSEKEHLKFDNPNLIGRVGNPLISQAVESVVTFADSVYDKDQQLRQSVINQELDSRITTIELSGGTGEGVTTEQLNEIKEQIITEVTEASDSKYLSKVVDDSAAGNITVNKNLYVGDYTEDEFGAVITKDGDAEFKGTVQINSIESTDWNSEERTGFTIRTKEGKSYAELDNLYVRLKAVFEELEIKKISHAGGNVVLSPASGNIYSVEKLCKTGETIPYAYRCYFIKEDGDAQIQNMWRVGDMVKCQTFNLSGVAQDTVNVLYDQNNPMSSEGNLLGYTSKSYVDASNRYYWRAVIAVGESTIESEAEPRVYNYIDLSNEQIISIPGSVFAKYGMDTAFEGQSNIVNDVPQKGDCVVQEGNLIDPERQNIIRLNTSGENAPSIIQYVGVGSDVDNPYQLSKHIRVQLAGNGENKLVVKSLEISTDTDTIYKMVIDKGAFVEGVVYNYYDRVSHNGSLWLCINESGSNGTTPSEKTSEYWLQQISKGSDGNSIRPKGNVATESQLPDDAEIGDCYLVNDTGHLWTYSETGWIDVGEFKGEKGDPGQQGIPGPIGPEGPVGKTPIIVGAAEAMHEDGGIGCYPDGGASEGTVIMYTNATPDNDWIDIYTNGVWEGMSYNMYDMFINEADGHLYQMTKTGWNDLGQYVGSQGEAGQNAVFYIIQPTVSYFKKNSSGHVCGDIQGHVYKIDGLQRTPVVGGSIALTYEDEAGNGSYEGDGLVTDKNGFFSAGMTWDGDWDDYNNAVIIGAHYHVGAEWLASHIVQLVSDGDSGKDAVNITLSPSSIILTEDEKNVVDITKATSQISVYEGDLNVTKQCTIGTVVIESDSKNDTVMAQVTSDYVLRIERIIGKPKTGKITIPITYQDVEYKATLQFAINWLGTWSATIKNDVYRAISQKEFSYIDEQGNTINVSGISTINQSADSIDTRVSATETQLGAVSTTLIDHASAIEQTAEQISLKVGSDQLLSTGINITSRKITLSADNTVFNGDVTFNGVIVENMKDNPGKYSGFVPIDMKNNCSLSLDNGYLVTLPIQKNTFIPTGEDNNTYPIMAGGARDNNAKNGYVPVEYSTPGTKLTITNKYSSAVGGWRYIQNQQTWRSYANYINDEQYNQDHLKLLQSAVMVVSDARLFNGEEDSIGLTTTGGFPNDMAIQEATDNTERWSNIFCCGGMIGRIILLLPGQTLKLTSSLVTIGGKERLIWNVDNPEEFTAIRKHVGIDRSWIDGYAERRDDVNGNTLQIDTTSMGMEATGSGLDANASIFGPKILCDSVSKLYHHRIVIALTRTGDTVHPVYEVQNY